MKAKKSILSTFIAASMLVMLTGCDVRTILPSSTEESSDSESVSAPASEESSIAETHSSREDAPTDIYKYYTQDNGSIVISKYNGNESAVKIPSTIDGKTVEKIGTDSFKACRNIKSITIPESVKVIEDWAFAGCSNLTSVSIPNSVKTIGERAFVSCISLTSITIPESVTNIGIYAFSECTSLTNVSIPNSVTQIGREAFKDCTSLKTITIPNKIKTIESGTFFGCTNLKIVTIPSSVLFIDMDAFHGCTSLKQVTIPDEIQFASPIAFDSDTVITYRGKNYYGNNIYEVIESYRSSSSSSSKPETPVVKRKTFTFNTLTGSIYGLDYLVGYPDYDEVNNYLAQGKTPKYINVDVYYQCPGCFRETFCSRVKYSYNKEEAQMVTNIHCDNPRCSHYNENSSALLCSNIKN